MIERRTIRQLSNAERDQILEQYLSDGIAIDKARIAELEAALIGIRELIDALGSMIQAAYREKGENQ